MVSTITGTVTRTVTLGKKGGYGREVRITDTGFIAPTAYEAAGVYVPSSVENAHVINDGKIIGASGGMTLTGGIGIEFAGSGRLDNAGIIMGGTGGASGQGKLSTTYVGGVGVDLAGGAKAVNSGMIFGGTGGYNVGSGADGGIGATIRNGTLVNTLSGKVVGGEGQAGNYNAVASYGGIGVDLGAAGILLNNGTIMGGTVAYYISGSKPAIGGIGVEINGGIASNTGHIFGGNTFDAFYEAYSGPGGAGVQLESGMLTNIGTISGGNAGYAQFGPRDDGGNGVNLQSGTISNHGVIIGGQGASSYDVAGDGGIGVRQQGGVVTNTGLVSGGRAGITYDEPGTSGTGVYLTAGTFINQGTVTGGAYRPKAAAGLGVVIQGSGQLTNSGSIIGGNGDGRYSGGTGVTLMGLMGFGSNPGFVNSGVVIGGTGGGYTDAEPGGTGGTGLLIGLEDSHATNMGTIIGGTGGKYAQGGTGVIIAGGLAVLTTGGTIIGGAGGPSNGSAAAAGDAVDWGSAGGTLVIDPGAVFEGVVNAANATQNVVALGAGGAAGTISGVGTDYIDLVSLDVLTGANWTVAGENTLTAASFLSDAGTLLVSGVLADRGMATIQNGTLAVAGGGVLTVAGITLEGGTLQGGGGALDVGISPGGAGEITVSDGFSIKGEGVVAGAPIIDNATITAQGGTLELAQAVSGSGAVNIAYATLLADGAVSGVDLAFAGAGTLSLGTPTSVSSTISGFASGDVVDLQKIVASTFSFAGGTLTLENGSTTVDQLFLAGSYTQADFMLASDKHGGTDVLYPKAKDFGATDLSRSSDQPGKIAALSPLSSGLGLGGREWPTWLTGTFLHFRMT